MSNFTLALRIVEFVALLAGLAVAIPAAIIGIMIVIGQIQKRRLIRRGEWPP